MTTVIKFCGMTGPADAVLALELGADLVGVILAPSPRRVDLREATRIAKAVPAQRAVAVVGEDVADVPHLCSLGFRIQFAGPIDLQAARALTSGLPYVRVVHLDPHEQQTVESNAPPAETLLFDTAAAQRLGGSGQAFEWSRIAELASQRDVIVAGGLNAANVAACIRSVRPFGVDVRTGIETRGKKDSRKMRAFVHAVRAAEAERRCA